MNDGNGNWNRNGNGHADNPWPDEATPVDTDSGAPAISEHADICSQVRELWQSTRLVADELHRIYLAIRHARTPIGPGILDDIASAIEMNTSGSQETVAMLRKQAEGMRAAGGR